MFCYFWKHHSHLIHSLNATCYSSDFHKKTRAFRHWRAPSFVLEAFSPPPSEGDSCLGNWMMMLLLMMTTISVNNHEALLLSLLSSLHIITIIIIIFIIIIVTIFWLLNCDDDDDQRARLSIQEFHQKVRVHFRDVPHHSGLETNGNKKPQSAQWRTIYGIFTYKLPTCTYVGKNLNPSLDTKIGLQV